MTVPKLKTKRAAKKRLKVTGTGKVVARHPYKSHLLTKKSSKRKRGLSGAIVLKGGEAKAAKRLIPNSL